MDEAPTDPSPPNEVATPRMKSEVFIRRVLLALEDAAHDYLNDYLRQQEIEIRRQVAEELKEDRAHLEQVTADAERLKAKRQEVITQAKRRVSKHRAIMGEVLGRLRELVQGLRRTPHDVLAEELKSCISTLSRASDMDDD